MNLLIVCAVTCIAVMGLLAALAVVIAILTALFPAPDTRPGPAVDVALLAAVQSVVGVHFGGARVIHMEEIVRS